jgi:hypothetical protein
LRVYCQVTAKPGYLGEEDRRLDVPADLFDEQVPIENGDSKIDRIAGREARPVPESLYIKRRPYDDGGLGESGLVLACTSCPVHDGQVTSETLT